MEDYVGLWRVMQSKTHYERQGKDIGYHDK